MRKNTFLSAMLLAASVSVANAQELVWQNSYGTGVWGVSSPEWGKDYGGGFLLPNGWDNGSTAIFDGNGKFTDEEGNPIETETIKLTGEMEVADIKVSGDKNYSISYQAEKTTDKIVGEGTLLKEGNGDFILNVLNELKGGTVVRGGRVIMEKADSPNAFGSKVSLEGGAVGMAISDNKNTLKFSAASIVVPEKSTGAITAGRYVYLLNEFGGKGQLAIYSGGERVGFTEDFAGKTDMVGLTGFEGELLVGANNDEALSPSYRAVFLNSTKKFDDFVAAGNFSGDLYGVDSTFVYTKVTLLEGAGFTSGSGNRCYAIGELNAEEGGWLGGYVKNSNSPDITYAVGYSNTDVITPVAIFDPGKKSYNWIRMIKMGTGTYTFTHVNESPAAVFKGLFVNSGRAYINIPVTETGVAFDRVTKAPAAMTIYADAVGGGNGRLVGGIAVEGGKLEVGYMGIGELVLADINGETQKSPLTVKDGGIVEFELASATSYDKLTTNNVATFNGNKIIVKAAESFDIKNGDTFTILDAAVVSADDTYEIEYQGFPAGLTFTAEKQEYQSGTKTEGEGEEATEVPIMGYKIVLTANGSGAGTGIEVAEAAEEVVVYAQDGNIVVNGVDVENVVVVNNQGMLIANSNSAIVPMNVMKGLYIVKVKTTKGIVIKKIVL
ncbi:T9SS C-terminal target domain-containing protein [Bacteroides sp.]|uniref:T9SS C-terminal target domain-containing protein n=1 Tax=Bacteroides sp. TaxID=29523 RepID=UPI0025BEE651|nr:T9SS C-terminal target domain-containing protein [Bacteroides sp.]